MTATWLVEGVLERLFGALSGLRGQRIFHPHGVGFFARLRPRPGLATGVELFDSGLERPAVVRLSRSFGLPEALPDPCGLAFRVLDAYGDGRHQDLLLVSAGRRPFVRHLPSPAWGFAGTWYSSLLPYRTAGGPVLIGGRATHGSEPRLGLAELVRRDVAGLSFELALASARGPWLAVADLALGRRLEPEASEALRLDPAHTGGGLEPWGWLGRVRPAAYRGSQHGRGAVDPGTRRDRAGSRGSLERQGLKLSPHGAEGIEGREKEARAARRNASTDDG